MSQKLAMLITCGAVLAAPCSQAATSRATSTTTSAAGTTYTAYYVSPTGSDSNNGFSVHTPFLTLERANAAMAGSSIKLTYLMGGVYHRTSTLMLNSSQDAGEYWIAYPGQTPILDGGGFVKQAIFIYGANNITIRWLTIQNYSQDGIWIQNGSNIVIDSNTIQNIPSNGWTQGGIVAIGNFWNGKITHNLIQNMGLDGIDIQVPAGTLDTHLRISYNAIYKTCIKVSDCGAIYTNDYAHQSTDIVISNNVIGGFGGSAMNSKGIYLDDMASYTTVVGNIIYGAGTYGLQIHGGNNNIVKNNIFDISSASKLGLYQYENGSMSGNTVTCNIVYSNAVSTPASLWDYLGSGVIPADAKNIYWKTSGQLPNVGAIVDPQPMVANPNFANTAAGNYATNLANPGFCGYAPISTATVGPLPH